MQVTIEKAIQTAIEHETRVRDVYREAAEKTHDDVGRKLFALLAEEEQGHLTYLEQRLTEWQKSGQIQAKRLKTSLPSRREIEAAKKRLTHRMECPDCRKEAPLVKRALEVERETSGYYERLVSEIEPAHQKLFAQFVEIEQGHLALVQAEYDAVTGLGYYYDMREFDLERG